MPIDPFTAYITTTTTIYVIVEIGNCASDATEITLVVVEPSDASWTPPTGLCESSGPILINPDGIAFHFMAKDKLGQTKIKSPQVYQNGRLSSWPDGFFDQWGKALDALLDD